MSFPAPDIEQDLRLFTERGLIADHEAAQVLEVVSDAFPFARAMNNAESIHVHVNADAVTGLPSEQELLQACRDAAGDDRERKFSFDSGLNVVLALDPTAQDELIPGAVAQAKPYVDHLGIDLREESSDTKEVFDAIPLMAAEAGWRHQHQGGPVNCCHVEMGPKHWVYPPEGIQGTRRPIEFAYGELKVSDTYLGCDYRPIDPGHPMAAAAAALNPCPPAGDAPQAAPRAARPPAKIYVFEECSCNTSPSRSLLSTLQDRYPAADVRAYDMAKPEGLVPLPPALFLALETEGTRCLPALVVDGRVRSQGWLPAPEESVSLIENPEQSATPTVQPATSASCCSADSSCC
jgi:Arsenical resistance operon protein ArsD